MRNAHRRLMFVVATLLLCGATDAAKSPAPPPSPRPIRPEGEVLFSDDFSRDDLQGWSADKIGVWSVRRGVLRAELPDKRQQHSFLYTGSSDWTDYAVDLDVCAMRGVDKGVAVRVMKGETGLAADLRGIGYHDLVLHRREWPLAKVRAVNANATWHHLRVEARDNRYKVWLNGALMIDKVDSRRSRPRGGIALAAYTGGVSECTLYYDNVLVTALAPAAATLRER